jgi:hypothetical protein
MVGHLRIERSAGSVSESPGQPARHDPQCRRRDSNSHYAVFEAAASASWATSAVQCGARGSNSPGSACRAVVLARGLAPRFGSGGGTRTPASALQRRASLPLDHSGSSSLRTDSNRRAQVYGTRRPPRSAAVAEVGFVAGLAKPVSRAEWDEVALSHRRPLGYEPSERLCSSPQHVKKAATRIVKTTGARGHHRFKVGVVLTAFAA